MNFGGRTRFKGDRDVEMANERLRGKLSRGRLPFEWSVALRTSSPGRFSLALEPGKSALGRGCSAARSQRAGSLREFFSRWRLRHQNFPGTRISEPCSQARERKKIRRKWRRGKEEGTSSLFAPSPPRLHARPRELVWTEQRTGIETWPAVLTMKSQKIQDGVQKRFEVCEFTQSDSD